MTTEAQISSSIVLKLLTSSFISLFYFYDMTFIAYKIICLYFLAEYVCHVFVRSDSLGAVLVTDLEYPQRVVFTLLNKVSWRSGVQFILKIHLLFRYIIYNANTQ